MDAAKHIAAEQETAGGLGLPDITINGMSGIGNTIQGPSTNPSKEWQISNVFSSALLLV